ncbi:hypothetical protein SpCBS45565_g04914 [Spizellomyces sp. 'palustris']|nr:hypothetical protein SpCBS45565_g04914 [Spizellomyces sp. 'palustris']
MANSQGDSTVSGPDVQTYAIELADDACTIGPKDAVEPTAVDEDAKFVRRWFYWNIGCVAFAWALGYIVQFIHVSATVVIAKKLIGNDQLSTIPLGFMSFGTILASFPLSLFGERVGMRWSFLLASFTGLVGAVVAFVALYIGSFPLLCTALFLQGAFMAGTQLLRYTAKTLSPPEYISRALSVIVGGAALGAVVGPNIAKYTEHTIHSVQYGGAYVVMGGLSALMMMVILLIRFPPRRSEVTIKPPTEGVVASTEEETRWRIVRGFLRNANSQIALIAGTVSYMIMVLFMAPVPLSMLDNNYTFQDQANVLMSHILGMFAPSLFTGYLIEKVGTMRMIALGFGFLMIGAGTLLGGQTLAIYFIGETFVGLGWNFAYITASALITTLCSTSKELTTIQGLNETVIAIAAAIFTLASGAFFGDDWDLAEGKQVGLERSRQCDKGRSDYSVAAEKRGIYGLI